MLNLLLPVTLAAAGLYALVWLGRVLIRIAFVSATPSLLLQLFGCLGVIFVSIFGLHRLRIMAINLTDSRTW